MERPGTPALQQGHEQGMTMATEIAGMPVKTEPGELMTPLAAVAVIKGLRDDGQITYWQLRTPDVTIIDAIGMHRAAAVMYEVTLPGAQ